MPSKRARGQFYTEGNPFLLAPFKQWAQQAGLPKAKVLEPFAGANNLIKMLSAMRLCAVSDSFDIAPGDKQVVQRNVMVDFPTGYDVCVTNPPWLARNSATRRGIQFPSKEHDNLYKHSLELCLKHCKYVAALLPAAYLHAELFQARLTDYILLHDTLFADTENPVCLALFGELATADVSLWNDDKCIGTLNQLRYHMPTWKRKRTMRFNDPDGSLGFISFDSTSAPSIRFCSPAEIADYEIGFTSRFITRIGGDVPAPTQSILAMLNETIAAFRDKTADVFLTPFKGLRHDGQYRRRMDYAIARQFLNAA